MSISESKLEANRANAQKSTGPTTTAGLEKISRNAFKHGLCGRFQVLPSESQAEYEALFESFMRAEQPADEVERELVGKMARHTWLAERALRCQDSCFIVLPASPEQDANRRDPTIIHTQLERFIRYHAAHDRAYQRASKELQERRKQRLLAERGFVSQQHAEAAEKRREKRSQQQDELHQVRHATAQINFQMKEQRYLKATAASGAAKTANIGGQIHQIAA